MDGILDSPAAYDTASIVYLGNTIFPTQSRRTSAELAPPTPHIMRLNQKPSKITVFSMFLSVTALKLTKSLIIARGSLGPSPETIIIHKLIKI